MDCQRVVLGLIFAGCLPAMNVPHGRLSLVSQANAVAPGSTAWIGLSFELDPDWHIYWINPGDSGVEPRVRWTATPGVTISNLRWPAPERLKDHGLIDYGYRGTVVLPVQVDVAHTAKGDLQIAADVHWAVCSSTCVAAHATLSLKLPVRSGTEILSNFQSVSRLPQPLPADCQPYVTETRGDFALHLGCPAILSGASFFPLHPNEIENAAPQVAGNMEIKLRKSEQLLHSPLVLEGVLETGNGAAAYNVTAPMKTD